MKRNLLLLFFLNLAWFANSQKPNKAETLLLEVSEKMKTYENIYVEFSHTFVNKAADIRQKTKGEVYLQGDRYHLNYMGTEQLFDGEMLHMIVHEDEEIITQKRSDEEESMLTPSKMYTFYKKGFTYEMDFSDRLNGVNIQYVKLTPIDRNSEVMNLKIGVNSDAKQIYNIIETGKNGTITEFTVLNSKFNQPLPSKIFELDDQKYKQMNYMISRVD